MRERYELDLRRRVKRQLSGPPRGLSAGVAAAAFQFIVGPLLDEPYRVGKLLDERHKGQRVARCGAAHRIRYIVDEATHTVIVVDVSRRADTYGSD